MLYAEANISSAMLRAPWIALSRQALRNNYQQIQKHLPEKVKIFAVVKADAYGHGAAWVATTLADLADGFAVATWGEARALRAVIKQPILLLHGGYPEEVAQADFYAQLAAANIAPVIHAPWQVVALLQAATIAPWSVPLAIWLKMDTGMQRLGLLPEEFFDVYEKIKKLPNLTINFFSHFASADTPDHPQNQAQKQIFQKLTADLPGARSLANSAAIVFHTSAAEDLGDWVRPGLLLYGIAPTEALPSSWALQPVMTLKSQLIAVRYARKGSFVGYNATWQCPEDMPLGVVAIGYADGYPRALSNVGAVLLAGQRLPVCGRVSMDLLVVDLRPFPQAQVGDEVTLWGEGLPVEVVASWANTIAYELLTRVTGRGAVLIVD
jgi:alanine racemase